MKKILGLDLGTNSIGWAVVNEAENSNENSSIIKLGVRTISYDNFVSTETGKESKEPEKDFRGGKGISCNAGRTLKRSARRNLQRYKLRRENLVEILTKNGFISDNTLLSENGNATTFETYRLRAKAAKEEISLEEFARVLLMINKKRGYKSSRKAKSNDEGQLIDGMSIALQLYENNQTPGQFLLSLINNGKKTVPDFYRSDLKAEFDSIWDTQKQFYPELLTEGLKEKLDGKNKEQTWSICKEPFGLVGIKRETKGDALKKENYTWRCKALLEKLDLESLVVVFQEINGQLRNSSGYLGAISDRSKELYFKKQTVGEYQMMELAKNPHYSLRNQVFYRQDYLDEFETIWETQSRFHSKLTSELKKELRDVVIFYQRSLKSQKGLISFCEFENRQIEIEVDGKKKQKTIGLRVCPKSSPLFQEFKIWQVLNNLQVIEKHSNAKRLLELEEKELLYAELNIKERISKAEALKILYKNNKELDLNFKDIEGNRTQATLFKAYQKIIEQRERNEYDFSKIPASKSLEIVTRVFGDLGYSTDILEFDSLLEGKAFEEQAMYKLWHLLYSFEGDNSKMGNERLIEKLSTLYGFDKEAASILANVTFESDYGSLSTKAMRNIMPHLKEGQEYSVACGYAGYRHSKKSLTKEELDNKVYIDSLELLPRNSLRNPVVEKILNQMINVVNGVVERYGKPDEIRIELARELKKSAKERDDLTKAINKATAEHEKYRAILKNEFGISNVSRNDIVRYKLYLELKDNGFKTIYSNTYIPREKLFTKEFDIEHIIPQAKLFDDSFSNKTLEVRSVNIEKSNATAYDYIFTKHSEQGIEDYKVRVETLFKNRSISKTKRDKLLMKEADIPTGFIERDLRDSQYIAKKAREILEDMVKFVVPTTGSVTDRLRVDWQLVDVMQELNFEKYDQLGLTECIEDKDGQKILRIKDWTKRNDHRHHAMDALTIAFTKRSFIQYLNNLNARSDKSSSIYDIEKNDLYRNDKGKLRFKPPMPLAEFRKEAKKHLENTLISIKAKNKVVTQNINVSKKSGELNKKIQLTPRGQLHNETVYGKIKQYVTKTESIGGSFTEEKIALVASLVYKKALLERLKAFGNDPKKAFTGKNSLEKNPIYIDELQTMQVPLKVKTVVFEEVYTIRKKISSDLKIDKVIDTNVRRILEARLNDYGGDAKEAFSNLDENPIWLNKEKGIAIKRVTIKGVSNAEPLHYKCDHNGKELLDEKGEKQPTDFVSTGNNHHVAIYRDADGKLQERVVSFYEAATRATLAYPIIDKTYKEDEGWEFLFSMKQNEYFVFPNYEKCTDDTGEEQERMVFNPTEIDLLDPENYAIISPNLYRVQKFSYKNYVFRHHLETSVDVNYSLKGLTWRDFRSSNGLETIVKVRVNHIGQIVSVGEY